MNCTELAQAEPSGLLQATYQEWLDVLHLCQLTVECKTKEHCLNVNGL
jgi:hypothetical protein